MIRIVGVVLIVLGLIALVFGGIGWTRREKVIDLGPIQATAERRHEVAFPPIAGVLAVVAGIALVVAGKK